MVIGIVKGIEAFPIVVLRGERQSGKRTVVSVFRQQAKYRKWFEYSLPNEATSFEEDHRFTGIDFLRSLQYITESDLVFFPRIDRLIAVLTDYHADNRNLVMLGFEEWLCRYTANGGRVIMTAHLWKLDHHISHLRLELTTTREDVRHVLAHSLPGLSGLADLSRLFTVQQPGHIVHAVKYATLMSSDSSSGDGASGFDLAYRDEMVRLTGNTEEITAEISDPHPEIDLIGLDVQIKEIEKAVVGPIEWDHPDVPIKRGLVLYGPPGTGKSSIGRWLAHRLPGKLHLIGGTSGISGSNFIETLEATMKTAMMSSPSIVFIDDTDAIFGQPDSYRALLTILDGLDNKRRANVCVIVTCMELTSVPSSLLRGGRLEMVLKIPLPDLDAIELILAHGFQHILQVTSKLIPGINVVGLDRPIGPLAHSLSLSGWNCSDLRRLIGDLLREILSHEGAKITVHTDILIESIRNSITDQYRLCNQDLQRSLALGSTDRPNYIL
jgi:hypothetical protein